MAKVMISIPDDLLGRLDARASAAGESRSGFLQMLAERELKAAEAGRREEVARLLDQVRIEADDDGPATWDVARLIREDRDTR